MPVTFPSQREPARGGQLPTWSLAKLADATFCKFEPGWQLGSSRRDNINWPTLTYHHRCYSPPKGAAGLCFLCLLMFLVFAFLCMCLGRNNKSKPIMLGLSRKNITTSRPVALYKIKRGRLHFWTLAESSYINRELPIYSFGC